MQRLLFFMGALLGLAPVGAGVGGCRNAVSNSSVAVNAQADVLVATLGLQATRTLEVPFQNDSIFEFLFSPDRKLLAGVGRGWPPSETAPFDERGIIFLYDVETGALLKKLATPASYRGGKRFIQRANWSLDGRYLAAWGENSQGMVSPLTVWDVQSGQAVQLDDPKWGASAAIWTKNGDLLVARTDQTNGLAPKGQLLVCDGKTIGLKKSLDLGEKYIPDMFLSAQEVPTVIVLKKVGGDGKTQDPIFQGALCSWDDATLSQPCVQFQRGEVPLRGAFDGQNSLALTGVSSPDGGDVKSLVAMVDLNRQQIVWRNLSSGENYASQTRFSPDKKQVWLPGPIKDGRSGIRVFDTRSGALSSLRSQAFPFFSADGQIAARLVETDKHLGGGQRILDGKRPHLKIAQIFKR